MAGYNLSTTNNNLNVNTTTNKLEVSLARVGPQGAGGVVINNYGPGNRDSEYIVSGEVLSNGEQRTLRLERFDGQHVDIDVSILNNKFDSDYTIAIYNADGLVGRTHTLQFTGGVQTVYGADGTVQIHVTGSGDSESSTTYINQRNNDQFISTRNQFEVNSDTGLEIVDTDGRAVLRRYTAPVNFAFAISGTTPAGIVTTNPPADFTLTGRATAGTLTRITGATATRNGANLPLTTPVISGSDSDQIRFTGADFDSDGDYIITVNADGRSTANVAQTDSASTPAFTRHVVQFSFTLSGVPANSDVGQTQPDFTVTANAAQHTSITSVTHARSAGNSGAADTDITPVGDSATFPGERFDPPGNYTITLTATGTNSDGTAHSAVNVSSSFQRTLTYFYAVSATQPASSEAGLQTMTDADDQISQNDTITVTGVTGRRLYLATPSNVNPVLRFSGLNINNNPVGSTFTYNDVTWQLHDFGATTPGQHTFTVAAV